MDIEKMITAVCGLIKQQYGVDLLQEEKVQEKGGKKRDSKGRFVKGS